LTLKNYTRHPHTEMYICTLKKQLSHPQNCTFAPSKKFQFHPHKFPMTPSKMYFGTLKNVSWHPQKCTLTPSQMFIDSLKNVHWHAQKCFIAPSKMFIGTLKNIFWHTKKGLKCLPHNCGFDTLLSKEWNEIHQNAFQNQSNFNTYN